MQLTKNNEVINLDKEAHIRAFLQSGWEEVKKPKQPKSSKNSRDKDET